MKWNRFTIKTKTEAEDMIICTLAEIGVEYVQIHLPEVPDQVRKL